jgi:hypothetical protein
LLLTKAALVDRFIVPDVDRAEAWAEILADVDLADAMVALTDHLRESDESVKPSHITRRVDEMKRDRELDRQNDHLAIATVEVDPEERRAYLAELMPDVFGEEKA